MQGTVVLLITFVGPPILAAPLAGRNEAIATRDQNLHRGEKNRLSGLSEVICDRNPLIMSKRSYAAYRFLRAINQQAIKLEIR